MTDRICTAGFARLDITPPLGINMAGHYEEYIATSVATPLYVNAVAFGEGDKSAVLLVCDLVGIYSDVGFQWPEVIAQRLGLPKEAVILCSTHTHTGPNVGAGGREPSDPEYDAWLLRRLGDVAQLALNDRKTVTDVRVAQKDVPGHTHVRRFKMKDGTYLTWGGPDIEDVACEGDDSLRVIRILREEGKEIDLISFQLHPDNVGGYAYCADFPLPLRDTVEEARDVHCVFINGAQGQMVPSNRMDPNFKPRPKSVERAAQMGINLANDALPLLDEAQSTGMTGLSFDWKVVNAKSKRDPSRMEEMNRYVELHKAGRALELGPIRVYTPLVGEAYVMQGLEAKKMDYVPVIVSGIAFCGAALVGLPGEPFNEIGKHVRAHSKFPVTCVICQANGSHGYLPTALAYEQGGYEPKNTKFAKGIAELLMETADTLLAGL